MTVKAEVFDNVGDAGFFFSILKLYSDILTVIWSTMDSCWDDAIHPICYCDYVLIYHNVCWSALVL